MRVPRADPLVGQLRVVDFARQLAASERHLNRGIRIVADTDQTIVVRNDDSHTDRSLYGINRRINEGDATSKLSAR